MSLTNKFYKQVPPTRDETPAFFRSNYSMLAVIFTAGFAWELGFNSGMNKIWDNYNRGRQWKDIRHKFVEGAEEEDDE